MTDWRITVDGIEGLTMGKLAAESVDQCDDEYCHFGDATSISYGLIPNKAATWDHDMVQVGRETTARLRLFRPLNDD